MSNTIKFLNEKGNVSPKMRDAVRDLAIKNIVPEGFSAVEGLSGTFVKEVGIDESTGTPVFVTLAIKATNVMPSKKERKAVETKEVEDTIDISHIVI